MDILLVPGLWLSSSIWSEVAQRLVDRGHHPVSPALPGVDDGSMTATLEDQVDAILAAVDQSDRPLVVGHSAACTLAWIVADRRPKTIAGVALIGGFPSGDGEPYADFLPITDGVMPFPGWEPFEGPDAHDLDAPARQRIEGAAIPVPEGVARGIVRLTDERRFDVPVVLVCPEYDPDQAKAWIDSGDVPELTRATDVGYVDINSGHWPMVSQPAELAAVIDQATTSD